MTRSMANNKQTGNKEFNKKRNNVKIGKQLKYRSHIKVPKIQAD